MNGLVRPCFIGFVVVATLFRPAFAQDTNLADVAVLKGLPLLEILKVHVWTASRKEERAVQTAAAVSVITQDDIRRSPRS